MIATLIVYAKTGEVANVIYGKAKAPEGDGQKREFVHMVVDIPEATEKELDSKTLKIDLSQQYTKEELAVIQDTTKVKTIQGSLKDPVKTIYTKAAVAIEE